MATARYHLTDDGPKLCRASVRACPLGGEHFDTKKDAETAYETSMSESAFVVKKRGEPTVNPKNGFAADVFYGDLPPRTIQLDALNGVADALEEDGVTQLVAACGTGKSYMGRQLMRRMMENEDANGVAVVLTSSIKLAQDTSADLRPNADGWYDHTLGEYGEDYRVIEVHSASKEFLKNGVVSIEKIAEAWKQAQAEGKKVVVVSTYESSSKVQEVQQALIDAGVTAEADLLMNDEAHNVLGQQRSASAKTEGLNSGYRSFHNDIPGAIQSTRRLYATATPVLQEMVSDDAPTAFGDDGEAPELSQQIEHMKYRAEKMDSDPKARITVYSDNSAIVGKVGGYISQQTAIDDKALAQPDYQLRPAVIRGNVTQAKDGYVDASGAIVNELRPGQPPLNVQTYAAVSSTLNAMVADGDPSINPVHNALAYCGTIEQAKAFRDSFKAVALEQSGDMSLGEAAKLKDSNDPELRRQARMRLLAEHADARAAYSGEESEVKKARAEAFTMFNGKSVTKEDVAAGWSPNKRVLANVDIFSEGVSINEIDTVVISDDEKTSERAMTQAIGRAIRRVSTNEFKSTGHVIIPQAVSENGVELNGGNVALAAYGATRVQRGVAISKLSGGVAIPDTVTSVAKYSPAGELVGNELAADIAKRHITSKADVLAAHTLDKAHKELLKLDPKYKERSASEQYAMMTSHIESKAKSNTTRDAYWAAASGHIAGKSVNELNAIRQSNRVLVSALGANDIGSLSPELTRTLIDSRIITNAAGTATAEATREEKRRVLENNSALVATALASVNTKDTHEELHSLVTANVRPIDVMKASNGKGDRTALETAQRELETLLSDDKRVDELFSFVSRKPEKGDKYSVIADATKASKLHEELSSVDNIVRDRAAKSAVGGDSRYELNRDMVRRIGDLKTSALVAMV